MVSGAPLGELGAGILIWAPLQALTTALVGIVVVVVFRDWLAIRLDE
ncbi:MAG: hypothetical protein R2882_03300 [Gemmatimonadales bacterium]